MISKYDPRYSHLLLITARDRCPFSQGTSQLSRARQADERLTGEEVHRLQVQGKEVVPRLDLVPRAAAVTPAASTQLSTLASITKKTNPPKIRQKTHNMEK